MRAIIVGGNLEADFVIKAFKKQKFSFVVVNGNQEIAKSLSNDNDIVCYCNETNKKYTYEDLDIANFDLVVALEEDDIRNFIICHILKHNFGVKKSICTVKDPDNVEVFKQLGIDSPISASFLLTQRIVNESNIESLIKTLTIENDRIAITEITVKGTWLIENKAIKDIHLPFAANISCIYRNSTIIIPRGDTIICPGDTLIIVSSAKEQNDIIDFLKMEKNHVSSKQK